MNTAEKQIQEEESIEGILLSIREIMMADGKPETPSSRSMDDAPVLDLTQLIRENGQIQEIPKPKAPIPENILKEIEKNGIKNKELEEKIAKQNAQQYQKEQEQEEVLTESQDDFSDSHPQIQDVFLGDDQTALNEIADMLEEDLPETQELCEETDGDDLAFQDDDLMDLESTDAFEPLKEDDEVGLFSLENLDDEPLDNELLDLGEETDDLTESLLAEDTKEENPDQDAALLGQDALASSLRALDQLDVAVSQTRLKPDPLFDQEDALTTNIPSKSLEDVIVQAVQPYLKAWLNTHLPTIVEQKVQEEIRRLVNKKLGSS
jgi:cell pole-organizing protein PopZ